MPDSDMPVFAVAQHLPGGFERVGYGKFAGALFAEMLFIDDKTAADGVIGFAVDFFLASQA